MTIRVHALSNGERESLMQLARSRQLGAQMHPRAAHVTARRVGRSAFRRVQFLELGHPVQPLPVWSEVALN
jgi:hypothetical protein